MDRIVFFLEKKYWLIIDLLYVKENCRNELFHQDNQERWQLNMFGWKTHLRQGRMGSYCDFPLRDQENAGTFQSEGRQSQRPYYVESNVLS